MAKVKTTFTYTEEMIDTLKHVALLKNQNQNEILEEAFNYWLGNQDEKFVKALEDMIKVTKNVNK